VVIELAKVITFPCCGELHHQQLLGPSEAQSAVVGGGGGGRVLRGPRV
jgi:hypothetical protein